MTKNRIQEVANKVFKQYAGKPGPGENMESLAASIVRWTDTSFDDALKALEISRKNIPRPKFNKLEKNPSEDFQNG